MLTISESNYGKGEQVLPPIKQRVLALKQILIDRGVITSGQIDNFVNYYEKLIGPHLGAAAVAQAWVDPQFRQQLVSPPNEFPFQATKVLQDFFFGTINPDTKTPYLAPQMTAGTAIGPEGEFIRIIENGVQTTGPDKGKFVHNIVACTVCSCYPQALLGVQPTWYKSQQYRQRVVADPLGVVDEFMQELTAGKDTQWQQWLNYRGRIEEVRVWDSNSEVRFFVIPHKPESWGTLNENQLRPRITRNSMLGSEILLS